MKMPLASATFCALAILSSGILSSHAQAQPQPLQSRASTDFYAVQASANSSYVSYEPTFAAGKPDAQECKDV